MCLGRNLLQDPDTLHWKLSTAGVIIRRAGEEACPSSTTYTLFPTRSSALMIQLGRGRVGFRAIAMFQKRTRALSGRISNSYIHLNFPNAGSLRISFHLEGV